LVAQTVSLRTDIPGYHIRPAIQNDLPCLHVIEIAAAQRFTAIGMSDFSAISVPLETYAAALKEDHLWVAETSTGEVVGFAMLSLTEDHAHLEEIDVLPNHGGRGLGRALIETLCTWVSEQGATKMTLSTFRDVPWNAPYYARQGFRVVPEPEYTVEMRQIRAIEQRIGLPLEERVIMVCNL
jgi:GNAT superfamily N-acetyltransferase